uniref:Clathrin light chain n=1 Tax=Haemonchus contortus TaxID=6289 RepID=A0A7I5EA67_HAECO
MNSEITNAENAESVGIDITMEHSESAPQPLNDWDDIGDQVRSMERGFAPAVAGNPNTAPTAGAERVAKYDRWASLNPNSQVVKIV